MNISIPASLINRLNDQINIDIDFSNAPEIVKQKVFKVCSLLWYTIYDRQVSDVNCTNLYFYTQINSKELDIKVFTLTYNLKKYRYTKFLNILVDGSLIEVNKKFKIGEFPMSYRINKSLITGTNFKLIDIDFKLLNNNNRSKSYWLKKYPEYKDLINDCYQTKIALVPYINWLHENEGIYLGKKSVLVTDTKNDKIIQYAIMQNRCLDAERIMRYTNAAIKHNLGNLWFKISDEGRFYNSVISLSSTIIECPKLAITQHNGFLLLNNKKLRSIDIANSQPLLLATMIDSEVFKADCGRGIFYQRIMEQTGLEKEVVKNRLYKYLFFTNNLLDGGELYNIFETIYPGVITQINAIKLKLSLAHHLQKMESKIIVQGAGRLNIPKILRHDQVLMHEEHYQLVYDYLKDTYRQMGVEVTFK